MPVLKLLLIAAAGMLLHAQTFAGLYDERNAQVAVSGNMAHGGVDAGRSKPESTFIGCDVNSAQSGSAVTCKAKDAHGASTWCTTPNAPRAWIEMVSGINSLSYISFFADSSHVCKSISVQQGSQFK